MTCPKCEENISILKVREELSCPKCGSLIKCGNYTKVWLTAVAVFLIITFIVDFLHIENFFIIVLYNVIIFVIVMHVYSKKIRCTVVREGDSKQHNENNNRKR